MQRSELESHFDRNLAGWLEHWKKAIRFASISADPAHAGDCLACAQWFGAQLAAMGLEAELLSGGGKPVVFARRVGQAGRPTVLFYGHYDVQPPDPLDAWVTPPFDPQVRDGRMYGRGAADNKGQVLYVLKAIETLVRGGAALPTVAVVLEGEEESGGETLRGGLEAWRQRLAADVLLVCDTGTVEGDVPTVVVGLRGIVNLTARLRGPLHDLHSGRHGGVAPNAAMELARLVATLHTAERRVAVEGFCDGAREPSARERELAGAIPFDPEEYRRVTGVAPTGGEPGYSAAEREGFRPTIELNGIHSGYGGAGSKTIIPAEAIAKLSARLVAGQDPERCVQAIRRHLLQRVPAGLRLDFPESTACGGAMRLDPDSPLVVRACRILEDLCGRPAVRHWEGASIPIIPALARAAGAEPLLVGFSLPDDAVHAPNESFSIEQFRRGYLFAAQLLAHL